MRAGQEIRRQRRAMRETPVIVPEYEPRFRCIGPACEDTCCHGWDLLVDRRSYEKYRSLPPGPLKSLVESSLVRIAEAEATEHQYAAFPLGPSRDCPMLTEGKLCGLQAACGESYLTRVCATFPRFIYSVNGIVQKPLMLACPEAARLVLLSKNLLPRGRHARRARWDDESRERRPLRDYFWPIRALSVQLIRNRRYALWQRLCLLGIFCRRLDALSRGEDERGFPELLADFSAAVDSGKLSAPMERVAASPALQVEIVLQLLKIGAGSGKGSTRLRETLAMCDAGLGMGGGRSAADLVEAYQTARRDIYEPFFRARPHILENYLANEMFRWVFPFGEAFFDPSASVDLQAVFGRLAIQFGLVQGVLTCVAAARGGAFCVEDVVRTVQVISRQTEHQRHFGDASWVLLRERGLDNLAGYAALLRS